MKFWLEDGKDNNLSAECARSIADYVNELVTQGKTIDKFAIMGALVAYYGEDGDND
jgi:cytochrome c-type biogenesis protein CcmH/NrfF